MLPSLIKHALDLLGFRIGQMDAVLLPNFSIPQGFFFSLSVFNHYFWPCLAACGLLVLQPGSVLTSSALEVWSPDHCTIREVPCDVCLTSLCVAAWPFLAPCCSGKGKTFHSFPMTELKKTGFSKQLHLIHVGNKREIWRMSKHLFSKLTDYCFLILGPGLWGICPVAIMAPS